MEQSPIKLIFFFLQFFIFIQFSLNGQQDSTTFIEIPLNQEDLIEQFIQDTGEEAEFDFNTIFEDLEHFLKKPIDLNLADESLLSELQLLTDIQINDFLNYRKITGSLVSIFELQSIPSFDLPTIHRILPYVSIQKNKKEDKSNFRKMLLEGDNELYIRFIRTLEEQKGFEADRENGYVGNPNHIYLRFKHNNGTRLRYGFTAEKDAGEDFFGGSNKQGFDYYSAHFYVKDYSKKLKVLALGDFSAQFGQGLVLQSGFTRGKGPFTMNIKRGGPTLKAYSSVSEFNFFRGAGATLNLSDKIEATGFASFQKRDGNFKLQINEEEELEFSSVTSLQTSGLHRTQTEIDDEKVVDLWSFGGQLKFKTSAGHIAINSLYNHLSEPLNRRPQLYNQYFFNGNRLLNLSLSYAQSFRNINFFGETAYSDNGAIATTNGLLIGLDRKADLAILHRHFPRDYYSIQSKPLAETTGARNETGLYIGLELRPGNGWRFNGYFDVWQHDWLRFTADAPSKGYEWLGRLTHTKRRKWETYVQLKFESKELNAVGNLTQADFLSERNLFQFKYHISYKVTKSFELRSRLDVGYVTFDTEPKQKGVSFFQDIIYRPIGIPLSFTTRFVLFDTDGYDIRFYAYENDLLYVFSIPAYYNEGTRFYLNVRFRGIRNLMIEARYEQTYWSNQDTFGSGLDQINGNRRSKVKMQLRYKF